MSIKIYVEGGGDSKALRAACRKGFAKFVERAELRGRMPRFVACGGRQKAYGSFATALQIGDGFPMLLVDSEDPVTVANPWDHLRNRDGWARPAGSVDDQCHLMVPIMESWFLADKPTLTTFYGQGFLENSLPQNPRVEQVRKTDVLAGLDSATRHTTKGCYNKGSHSFDILVRIDPSAVERAAPRAKRFLDTLRTRSPA